MIRNPEGWSDELTAARCRRAAFDARQLAHSMALLGEPETAADLTRLADRLRAAQRKRSNP